MSAQRKIPSFFFSSSTSSSNSENRKPEEYSDDSGTDSSDSENELDHEAVEAEATDHSRRPTSKCTSTCCFDEGTGPVHPKGSKQIARRKRGKQSRSLCINWFDEHPWLTFCETNEKVFCFYCRKAHAMKIMSFSTKSDLAFISAGFDNWKKVKARFRSHQRSHTHNEAVFKLKVTEQPSIIAQLDSCQLRDQEHKRKMLLSQLNSFRYFARQGLAVRGHKHEEGNLFQFLKCQASVVHGIDEWLKSAKYLSQDIVNELIEIMAHSLLRSLLTEIRQSPWFSLIADETRDESGLEQLSISIRRVDESYLVYEDIVGMMELQQTDALTIANALKDVLLRYSLPLRQCRGQAYDGASNMAGRLNGVAARLLREEPRAQYVHCLAHSLNLCPQECSCKCSTIREALNLAQQLANLIRASPKRLGLFKKIKAEMAPSAPGIKPLCPTRWTVSTSAIDAVLKNYLVIDRELEELVEKYYGEPSRKAYGLRAILERFATYFGLRLSFLVFSATEQLSVTLQGKDINTHDALSAAEMTKTFLQRQRSDSAFASFYQAVAKEAESHTNEPVLPRRHSHLHASPTEYLRQQYFEVFDILIAEISRRFDRPVFTIMQEIETLLLQSCAAQPVKPSAALKSMYKDDLDFNNLEFQLNMLPDLIKTANKEHQMGIKKVTSINTVCEVFNNCTFAKTMLSEVHKVIQIYLTVPVTSAERSFSVLRRVKNYLRTTMTEKRLNQLILLHSHKHRTDNLSMMEAAKEFAERNERRQEFFWNF